MAFRPLAAACLAALTLAACSHDGGKSSKGANEGHRSSRPSATTGPNGHGGVGPGGGGATEGGGGTIEVVAAENTWGSIVAGLGGNRVHVTSVVADPNADPHDYEATVANARSVANARLVVLNGGGYDAWMERLLAADGGTHRVVNAAVLLPGIAATNVHLFANPGAVQVVSTRITAELSAIDPADAGYFNERLRQQAKAWNGWVGALRSISIRHGGTMVSATENLALPVLQRAGLRVATPTAFMRAVAQGVDPAPRDVELARSVLTSRSVKLLASNLQATTPITDQLLSTAEASGVPVVDVFEVLPRGMGFYAAMDAEAAAIARALNGSRA